MYVGNWYSTVDLAESLLKKMMNLVGTLRKNRKTNPKAVTTQKLKKSQIVAQQNATGVMVLKWLDKREVLVIFIVQNDAKADNGKPAVVVDYNQGKSFVDLSDQMHSYQAFERKTYKWYMRIFFSPSDPSSGNKCLDLDEYAPEDEASNHRFQKIDCALLDSQMSATAIWPLLNKACWRGYFTQKKMH